ANSDVTGITAGPDGALWYSVGILDHSGGKIGRITTDGVVTEYPLPIAGSWPSNITTGPDGALWFSLAITNGGNMIGRMSTAGAFIGYPIPANDGNPGLITTGPDGALWFTLVDGPGDNIGRLTTAGALTVYRINTLPSGLADGITVGPDGALWFTEPHDGGNFIGRITTAGVVTQFPIPGQANAITAGPDGALWFTFIFGNPDPALGRITTTGTVTTYPLHTLQPAGFNSIVTGPDGALWIADGPGWIGRAAISPAPTPTISAPAPPLGAPGASYSTSLSAFGGVPPYSHWTVSSGSLPPGLTLDAATGAITGVATSAGTFNFGVTFEDSTGATSAEQIVSITINLPNPGLNMVGSMPHLAGEENWTTTFTLINKTAVQSPARLSLFGDLDSGTLPLPLIFPQQPGGNPLLTASFEQNIAPNASLIVQTAGPQTGPVKVGSAQVATTGAIDGFAIFHHVVTGQETVVPLEAPGAGSYLLAFDNTGGSVLGIALANPLAKSQNIGVGISDDNGTFIEADSLIIPANGHISFVLPAYYPVTANRRGTITFYAFQGGQQFGVLGMRFAAPNNALTTIPGLTGGAGVSSIAHIATGNGWKTTFVLVNFNQTDGVGQSSPFQLNFFDDNGNPLALPVGYPQTASGTNAVTTSVQQTLAPNATLIIESAAPLTNPAPTIGSAQLSTNGSVAGFVMFRYEPNGQEAVVPFESRKAGGYLLAFDNTAGTATGVAVNNASAQVVGVPVVIRDDAGNLLATDTLHLAANGHLAFTLATDKYPITANIRGTIEFDTPSGAQIGALAFRIPVGHTFTTLPALAVSGTCVPTLLGCL
ncbi:MAG TPA: putative Ig domain-containing protein, partial [Bryobacteraceae bacterium]|nr:putative Ig domain-containing protein [Bryobacteraceae bacterium]